MNRRKIVAFTAFAGNVLRRELRRGILDLGDPVCKKFVVISFVCFRVLAIIDGESERVVFQIIADIGVALRAERVRLGCYVRLPARSIPALLLSLLTALILAFADTLPKLAVRRALCADGMSDIIRFERKTQSHGTT